MSTSTSVLVFSLRAYRHNWIISCYFLISRCQHLILHAHAETGSWQIVLWLRIARPVCPSLGDPSRPFHLRPGTARFPELHTLLHVERNTKSRKHELCILFMYIHLFSVMIASSSTTVERTKQTLVLSSKRPSVCQEYNFTNTTNSIRVLLTIYSFFKNMKFPVFTPWSYRGSR